MSTINNGLSYAKSEGIAFHAPKKSESVKGVYHRNGKDITIKGGSIGFKSTAVINGTIFWKQQ